MEKVGINGVELEYEATGSGEPILLISTGPIRDSFLPLFTESALTERYRLIRYRQRRLDRSADSAAPVSFAEHAADAAALLEHLGFERAHVAGHSTGAAIALQLAADRPEVVHTLALLEPPLLAVPSAPAFFEKAGPALGAYGSGDREGAMTRFLSMVSSLEWETCRQVIEKHIPGGAAEALENSRNFFDGYLPALTTWEFGEKRAASILRPVLSVLGSDTERLFVDSDALLQTWFPQLQKCTIGDVAHLLHMQQPTPVARGMAEFFARHPCSEFEPRARPGVTAPGPGVSAL